MKSRTATAALLAVCGVLASAGAARCGEGDQLAAQAQEILSKHCGGCHGGGPRAKAGLNVLDRDQLVTLKLINLDAPAASELLDLIETGAMPPGKNRKVPPADRKVLRAWVEAKAPSEPPAAYVMRHLLRDWKEQKEGPNLRYLTLAHLAHADRRQAVREDLTRLLKHFSSGKDRDAAPLAPIDPAGLVLRIDLEALGWDRKPFKQRDFLNPDEEESVKWKASPINLYDLLLLEYPYGSLSFTSASFPAVKKYLARAAPCRPVPHLRADWLVAQLSGGRLSEELAILLGLERSKQAPAAPSGDWFRKGVVTLATAQAELGFSGDRDRLTRAIGATEAKALAEDKTVSRAAWEAAYPEVVRRLGAETPILPLDGLDAPGSLLNRPPGKGVSVAMVDRKTKEARGTFAVNEDMIVKTEWTQDVVFELLRKSDTAYRPRLLQDSTKAKKKSLLIPENAGLDVGTESFILFAMPRDQLKGDFPRGLEMEAPEGVRCRYVHPFYAIAREGDGFAGPPPEKMITARATFTIKSAPKDK